MLRESMQQQYDVIIIGAGASGLMCALQAAKRGRRTLVLEHGKQVGRKILIAGGGKCNFTNYEIGANNYLCSNPHFVKSALAQYTNWDFISLISKFNLAYEERKHGQLFFLDSAKFLVKALENECVIHGVKITKSIAIEKVEKTASKYAVILTDQNRFTSSSLVIATGGLSMPKLGATPFGYKVAEQFKIPVIAPRAALVPFTLDDNLKEEFAKLAGIALDVAITTKDNTRFLESLLFTHRGLSGPVVLQSSSYWKNGESIKIDFLPYIDLFAYLTENKESNPKQMLKTTLSKILPKKLVNLLAIQNIVFEKSMANLSNKDLEQLVDKLTNYTIEINGTEGYRTAEVTLGGVDTNFISSKTLECKTVAGLFFIGEVLDVTGWLGGYNLQWAWSSGWVAGENV